MDNLHDDSSVLLDLLMVKRSYQEDCTITLGSGIDCTIKLRRLWQSAPDDAVIQIGYSEKLSFDIQPEDVQKREYVLTILRKKFSEGFEAGMLRKILKTVQKLLSGSKPAYFPRPLSHIHNSNDFEVQSKLGSGGFGRVYKCVGLLDDLDYALKQVRLPLDVDDENLIREVKILCKLEHPNVVKYFQSWIVDRLELSSSDGDRSTQRSSLASDSPSGNGSGSDKSKVSSRDAGSDKSKVSSRDSGSDRSKSGSSSPMTKGSGLPRSRSPSPGLCFGSTAGSLPRSPLSPDDSPSESIEKHKDILPESPSSKNNSSSKSNEKPRRALYILMEFCPETLLDLVLKKGRLDRETVIKFLRQIGSALSYIHGKGVVHRDISSSNVFVDSQDNIKIGDFGLAKQLQDGSDSFKSSTKYGNENYKAPEMMKQPQEISSKVDMYALGLLSVELFHPMKSGTERIDVLQKAKENILPDSLKNDSDISSIIHLLLAKEPENRLSAEGFLEKLEKLGKAPEEK